MSNPVLEEMEAIKENLILTKNCFGDFEEGSNSWHCVGCIIKEECKKIQDRRSTKNVRYINSEKAI